MDDRNRVVSTVAIKDGRFLEVGSGARWPAGPRRPRVIDLRGKTVVPGIIDNHNHLVLMGNRPGYHTPLENARSIADAQATYAARATEVPAGAWITTIGGFHSNHLYADAGRQDDRPLPDARRARRGGAEQPGVPDDQLHRPGGDQQRWARSILQGAGRRRCRDTRRASRRGSADARAALLYLRQTLLDSARRAGAACSTA